MPLVSCQPCGGWPEGKGAGGTKQQRQVVGGHGGSLRKPLPHVCTLRNRRAACLPLGGKTAPPSPMPLHRDQRRRQQGSGGSRARHQHRHRLRRWILAASPGRQQRLVVCHGQGPGTGQLCEQQRRCAQPAALLMHWCACTRVCTLGAAQPQQACPVQPAGAAARSMRSTPAPLPPLPAPQAGCLWTLATLAPWALWL